MLWKRLSFAILMLGTGVMATQAMAQDSSDGEVRASRPFGGLFNNLLGSPTTTISDRPAPPNYSPKRTYERTSSDLAAPRAGSVSRSSPQPTLSDVPDEPPASATPSIGHPASSARPSDPPAKLQGSADDNLSFEWSDKPAAKVVTPAAKSAATEAMSAPAETAPGESRDVPLHERLKGFRRSAFSDPAPAASNARSEPAADTPSSQNVERGPAIVRQAETNNAPGADQPAADAPTARLAERLPSSAKTDRPDAGDSAPQLAPPRLGAEVPAARPAATASNDPPAENRSASAAKPAVEGSPESNVLFARKSPILSIETIGPRRMVVGKEATFEVTIQNSGEVAADGITVLVGLPEWADVAGAQPSVGETHPSQARGEPYQWTVGHIDAKARERLVLKIVSRQSKPFDLAVRWDYKPAASQATIEVQEPKLVMRLDGPREVFFGKREVYKLKLSNSGNGPAENVVLNLASMSSGESQPVSHRIGTLNAGEERTIEIELTARQAGNLVIQVSAQGDSNARVDLTERVVVRRPSLKVNLEGPAVQYVGTQAAYKVRVFNPGDAPAKGVKVGVTLPTGVKFATGTEGAQVATTGNKVQWNVDNLEAGGERVFTLRCALALSGASRLEVTTTADDDLTASSEATTRVEAMADLRLEVKDPEGPVPVGEDAVYELRIRNRGTKTAENVEVMAYFSSGIEPTSAEGYLHRISTGQVVFNPIASVAPGAEVTLRVKARADAVGNHIFRAEVHCKPLGTRLVREETTHFYQEATGAPQTARTGEPASKTPVREPVQTAERSAPLPLPQAVGTSEPAKSPEPASLKR